MCLYVRVSLSNESIFPFLYLNSNCVLYIKYKYINCFTSFLYILQNISALSSDDILYRDLMYYIIIYKPVYMCMYVLVCRTVEF